MARATVNVVISMPTAIDAAFQESSQNIRNVSRRVILTDIINLVIAKRNGDIEAGQKINAILGETEVLYGFLPEGKIVACAPKLKWIQTPMAGAESILTPDVVSSSIIVTNSRFHGPQISELAFNLMLMLARQSPQQVNFQTKKKWQSILPELLHGKTLGVLGLGSIGQAVAHLGKAFRMRVIALRAHPEAPSRYVDAVFPSHALHEVLAQSDFVVLTLPLTAETQHIIREAELRVMKPNAFIINVGRGGLIDEDALVRALQEKRIGGAGLDVFAKEPLPQASPLWELPNVIVSPHNAGMRKDYFERATEQFCQNLRRYLRGQPLMNIVDKVRGY